MKPGLCLFTDSADPSGVGEHMLTLAQQLRHRCRVSFICPPSPAGLDLIRRARALGIDTLALRARGKRRSTIRLQAWLQRQEIDIFHGHAGITWEGHEAIFAARAAGAPVVLRTEHLPYLITDAESRAKHTLLLPALDRLICVSAAARASFVAVGVPATKLRVVRNGVTLRPPRLQRQVVRRALGIAPSAPVLLTVARFTEQKGHRCLLDALALVTRRARQARLLLAGEGDLRPQMEAHAAALGLEEHVRFLGRRDDVPDLLGAVDLFVLPSTFEGLPLAALEAMAAGLPVIGTAVTGLSEVVVDHVTGRLVPPGEPWALAAAILEGIGRPEARAEWGAAGRERYEREFTAGRMARETAAIYDELLPERALRARQAVRAGFAS